MALDPITITIANNGTKSTGIRARGRSLIRIRFPTMTSTAVTIQGADNDVDAQYQTIGNESGAFTISSPSTRCVCLPIDYTYGYNWLRLVGGTAEGGERTIDVYANDYLG